jgi:hypothetical protein
LLHINLDMFRLLLSQTPFILFSFMTDHSFVTRRVLLVKQELPIIPEFLSSHTLVLFMLPMQLLVFTLFSSVLWCSLRFQSSWKSSENMTLFLLTFSHLFCRGRMFYSLRVFVIFQHWSNKVYNQKPTLVQRRSAIREIQIQIFLLSIKTPLQAVENQYKFHIMPITLIIHKPLH